MPNKSRNNVKRLLNTYFKPSIKRISLVIILILVSTILTVIDPFIIEYIIDKVILQKKLSLLASVIAFSLIVKLFNHLLIFSSDYLSSVSIGYISKQIVFDLYQKVQSLSMPFFNNNKLGKITQRIYDDTFIISEDLFHVLIQIITSLFSVIVSLVVIFYLNVKLATVSLVIIPLFMLFIKILRQKFEKVIDRDRKLYDNFTSFVQEKLSAIQLVKEMGIEKKILEQMNDFGEKLKNNTVRFYMIMNINQNGTEFFRYLGPMTVLFYGAFLYNRNEISLGTLTGFFYFIAQLYTPISLLATNGVKVKRAIVSINRIFEYFDLEPQIKNPLNPKDAGVIIGKIDFGEVCFGYNQNQPILKNLNFEIKPNDYIAFVGRSGAGKSTIINLLFRLYDVNQGRIKLNNIDIKDFKTSDLREKIALVSQNIILFHASIRDNLKIINENISDEEMIRACKLANIDEYIQGLPLKYDTVVGEKGVKLSGGQKQRISIARALLKKSPILILDEATSHLDSKSERLIQESLEKIKKETTMIVIAHRLSTVINCDKIFVLKNGQIIEEGSHQELLEQNGEYRNLWDEQNNN